MRLGLCCLWRRGGRSVRQRTERAAPLPYSVSQLHSKSGGVIDQTLANRLLAALPRVERQSLLAHCEYVELTAPLPLQEAQGRLRHAYFPVDSTISVLAPADRRRSLEIGAVGSEGLFGPESRMEMESFELKGLIQGSGHAWRVDAATLQHLATSHEGLNAILLKYLHVVLVQTARSVACCRFHSLEQRLARWLLTHSDRSWSTDLPVTHDQLAGMLGARRAGVTVAAGQLEQRGLISGGRGHIVVKGREQLMEAACSCYLLDQRTYEQGMGVPPSARRY
jgi:CRP-like cAMP-binding protein